MTAQPWPAELPVQQVRIARPTDQLEEVVRFYRDGLGLAELGRFAGFADCGIADTVFGTAPRMVLPIH